MIPQGARIVKAMTGLSKLASRCKIASVPGSIHAASWLLNPQGMSEVVQVPGSCIINEKPRSVSHIRVVDIE